MGVLAVRLVPMGAIGDADTQRAGLAACEEQSGALFFLRRL